MPKEKKRKENYFRDIIMIYFIKFFFMNEEEIRLSSKDLLCMGENHPSFGLFLVFRFFGGFSFWDAFHSDDIPNLNMSTKAIGKL